jgi:cation transport regulator ChaB
VLLFMPQFKDAPDGANEIMHSVYKSCMAKTGKGKSRCSKIAIGAMKKSYYRTTDGNWHKKGE